MFRFLFSIFSMTACVASAADSAKNRHVILITVDGGAAFYFDDSKAPIPNIRKLATEGVVAKGVKIGIVENIDVARAEKF